MRKEDQDVVVVPRTAEDREQRHAVQRSPLERIHPEHIQHRRHHVHRDHRELLLHAIRLDRRRVLDQANLAGAALSRVALAAAEAARQAWVLEVARALAAGRVDLRPILDTNTAAMSSCGPGLSLTPFRSLSEFEGSDEATAFVARSRRR